MLYHLNPHKHVKIWLSKNPDVFMNLENQMRLREMRKKNPKDEIIHLCYDSSLLNKRAQNELHQFCEENNFIPVDINTFSREILSPNEKELYEFYQEEIRNLGNGGNLAVASDIARWLSPIYRLGCTYTDLDVPVDTTTIIERDIAVAAPLLLNIGSIKIGARDIILANNDYVVIVDEKAAKEKIEKIQAGLLRRLRCYDNDFIEKTEKAFPKRDWLSQAILKQIKNRSETVYIKKSKELNSDKKLSSRELRAYVHKLMTDPKKFLEFKRKNPNETQEEIIKKLRKELKAQLNLIKWLFFRNEYIKISTILLQTDDEFLKQLMAREHSLYLSSIVICTTGPIEIANSLFDDYVKGTAVFDQDVRPLSFKEYNLDKAFYSENSIRFHENLMTIMKFLGADTGTLNDSSWLPEGISLQALREAEILDQRDNFAANLPQALLNAKQEIEQYISNQNDKSSEVFQEILRSFANDEKEFNVAHFQDIISNHHMAHKSVLALQRLVYDAQIYDLIENDKINLVIQHKTEKKDSLSSEVLAPDNILRVLEEKIRGLENLKSTPFNFERFIFSLKKLQKEIEQDFDSQKENNKKILHSKSYQIAKETINMIDQLQKLDLDETNCNIDAKRCRMIKRIHTYDKQCYELLNTSRLTKVVTSVITAAIGAILGAVIGAAIGLGLGIWTGPGALVTSLVGSFYGAYSGAFFALTIGTAVITASLSHHLFFKPHYLHANTHGVASSLFGQPSLCKDSG